jgi:hypothetical protein
MFSVHIVSCVVSNAIMSFLSIVSTKGHVCDSLWLAGAVVGGLGGAAVGLGEPDAAAFFVTRTPK